MSQQFNKGGGSVVASTSRAAGAGVAVSAWVSLAGKLAADLTLKITNSTAPTTGCTAIVETAETDVSPTRIKEVYRVTHTLTASEAGVWPDIPIPASAGAVRVTFQGNVGGGAVTVEAFYEAANSIG